MSSAESPREQQHDGTTRAGGPIEWLSTGEAASRLGITARTLYRFIDEGQLPAYRLGRVIRLKADEVDTFIESCRIAPGSLEHLYPDSSDASATESNAT
ncbi:MAG: helix-turn-helix domain-containing protein [Acidimicrobiia bacterium]|nr:helix-turn-helix domain-containing protein [Acidimicrobiia bacterium]